jgi:hypothetical protein
MADAEGAKSGKGRIKDIAEVIVALSALVGAVAALYSAGIIGPGKTSSADVAPLPSTTVLTTAFRLPAPEEIVNHSIEDAEGRLEEAGFIVRLANIGCSNSTSPLFVRQVTAGRRKNEQVIYGKVTDDIDEKAVRDLKAGDELTVWTPSASPCPG